MFPLKIKNKSGTCIIDNYGIHHSYNDMNNLIRKAEAILIKGGFERIAIKDPNKAVSTAVVIACLNTGTDFIIIPNKDKIEFNIRINLFDVDLIFDDKLNYYHLTINLLNDDVFFNDMLNSLIGKEDLILLLNNISDAFDNYKTLKLFKNEYECYQGVHHCIHNGRTVSSSISKYSGFNFLSIFEGIKKASLLLSYNYSSSILYMEEFDLLYDIVNGIIAPLICGRKVIFKNSFKINTSYTMYASNKTLEKILNPMYNKQFLPVKVLTPISRMKLKYDFKRKFGKLPDNVIITGKINNKELINLFSDSITSLYTMCEIVSFVAKKNWTRIIDTSNMGSTTCDVIIAGVAPRPHGILMIHSDDMAHITNDSNVYESFVHNYKGRLNTKDVGYFSKKSELHVFNKSNLTFEKDKVVISTDMVLSFIKKQIFVNNAILIKSKGSFPLVFISPSKTYISEKKLELDDLYELTSDLQERVNVKFEKIFNGNLKVKLFELDINLDEDIFKMFADN